MKDDIENIIKENRNLWNVNEPPEGHLERFKQKLDKQHQATKPKFHFLYGIAASVVICLVGTFLFISNQNRTMSLSEISPEYEQIESYYNQIINDKAQQLQNNSSTFYASYIEDNEAMERAYEMLQKELYRNPNNQFVIESMMANYKTRVNMLDNMNQKFEIINIAQK